VDWIYAEIQVGRIPGIKVGAEWRISRDAFEEYIKALTGEKDQKSATPDAQRQ